MLHLRFYTKLHVKVNNEWVPFSVFENGRHGPMLKTWIEDMQVNNGMDNDEAHAMILAEALGTSIRFVDSHHGVSYIVEFARGKQTQIAAYSLKTGFHIKTFAKGGHIPQDFDSEIQHVIDI